MPRVASTHASDQGFRCLLPCPIGDVRAVPIVGSGRHAQATSGPSARVMCAASDARERRRQTGDVAVRAEDRAASLRVVGIVGADDVEIAQINAAEAEAGHCARRHLEAPLGPAVWLIALHGARLVEGDPAGRGSRPAYPAGGADPLRRRRASGHPEGRLRAGRGPLQRGGPGAESTPRQAQGGEARAWMGCPAPPPLLLDGRHLR